MKIKRNYRIILISIFAYSLSLIAYNCCLCYGSFDQQYSEARSMGMGGAFVGLSDNGESIYYNVSGISNVSRMEINGSYSKLYVGLDDGSNLSDSNMSYMYPIGGKRGKEKNGVVGIGVNIFSLENYYSESVVGIYYGKRMNKKVRGGLGIKYLGIGYGIDEYTGINEVFRGGMKKGNISIDLGMGIDIDRKWKAGMSIRDVNSPDMGLKYSDKVAAKIGIGGSYHNRDIRLAGDIDIEDNNFKIIIGGEKKFLEDKVSVRGGIGVGSRKYSRISLGGGYEWTNIVVDYGFNYQLSGISDMYGTHRITVGYRFGDPVREDIEEAKMLYEQSMEEVKAGRYKGALIYMNEAWELRPEEERYVKGKEKLVLVTGYIEEVDGEGKYERAIKKGLSKYIVEGDVNEGLDQLQYGYSLRPDGRSASLDKLIRAMAIEYNVTLKEISKQWNLAEQKLFQALDRFTEKKYDACIRLCEEVLKYEPENLMAYKRLGSSFYILGNKERAQANWQKVIELAPNDPEVPEIRRLMREMK